MPHVPKAFCADCAVEMVVDRAGVTVETLSSGIRAPDGGPGSYYKVQSDRLVCPACGHGVLTGMPAAVIEHFEPGYAEVRADIVCHFADQFYFLRRGGASSR